MKLQNGKKIAAFLGIIGLLFVMGCGRRAESDNDMKGTEEKKPVAYTLTQNDTDVSMEGAVEILLEEQSSPLVLNQAGAYLLKGTLQGQLQIDVQDENIHLILENVEITSPNGPAIYVKSAAKTVITIPEASESILVDSPYYDEFPKTKATLYSESDLTINGSGNLQVYGYYKDGIRTKDFLKVLDTRLEVQAKNTGLRGNDGVALHAVALELSCEGTGILTEKEGKEDKGFVNMTGGTAQVIAGEYGIRASENVYIQDCRADIYGIVGNIACSGEQFIEEGCLE